MLARIITALPEAEYRRCQAGLARMIEQEHVELFASNQVIGLDDPAPAHVIEEIQALSHIESVRLATLAG